MWYTIFAGEDIKKAHYLAEGKVISKEVWDKYGHLLDHKLIPAEYISPDFKPDDSPQTFTDMYDGFSAEALKVLVDPYACPLMADSLSNLPPAMVISCKTDTLRDEAILYARRLQMEGTTVEHYHDEHGYHGMISLVKGITTQAALDAFEAIIAFIKKIE